MVKFVKIRGQYVQPQHVESIVTQGPQHRIALRMVSGDHITVGDDMTMEEVVALLEGRDTA